MNPHRGPVNVAASVRARLFNLSRQRRLEFQLILSEFSIERLLYRLGVSGHSDRFILKGAMLFKLWSGDRHRATWDLDLLGYGENTIENVVSVIRDLCAIEAEDGILFDADSVRGEEIRAADEYAGVRIRFNARLAEARIPMQVDVGFGDIVAPAPILEIYPTLLDHTPPRILVYPREAVVAEKLEAMITLGVTNSRMKDFYDIHVIASSFEFDGRILADTVRKTFQWRNIPFPETEPLVLTRPFLEAPERRTLWQAFLRRGRLDATPDAGELADSLRRFLWPVIQAAARSEPFPKIWPPGGPWRPKPQVQERSKDDA